jgi:hypothetical protein
VTNKKWQIKNCQPEPVEGDKKITLRQAQGDNKTDYFRQAQGDNEVDSKDLK